jgi:hypothetical protein
MISHKIPKVPQSRDEASPEFDIHMSSELEHLFKHKTQSNDIRNIAKAFEKCELFYNIITQGCLPTS